MRSVKINHRNLVQLEICEPKVLLMNCVVTLSAIIFNNNIIIINCGAVKAKVSSGYCLSYTINYNNKQR